MELIRKGIQMKKILSLLIKNIKNFIINQPLFFTILCIGQIVSVVIFITSIGTFRELKAQADNDVHELCWGLWIICDDGDEIPIRDAEKAGYELEDFLKENFWGLDYFAHIQGVSGTTVCTGVYSHKSKNGFQDEDDMGFTYQEDRSDEHIAIVPNNYKGDMKEPYIYDDIEYKIKGRTNADIPFIPIRALSDRLVVHSAQLSFMGMVSVEEGERITAKVRELFGDKVEITGLDKPIDLLRIQGNNVINFGVIITIAIVIINLLICLGYVLKKRKNWLMVVRLTGCDVKKARFLFMLEMCVLLFANLLIGMIIFRYMVYPRMLDLNHFYREIYSAEVYARSVLIYIVISLVIFRIGIMSVVNKNVIELK